ncbi:hypothetical protein [Nitrospina watsonii]|uniref:Uncharacterized protein n=1 Tax=Nitrospina watsonii TaxID=1323948 RepID=A0ABM9HFK6_9BACT|nr:hypothetical protein [Nitrospina watsonii]CAI2718785.1 conserved protein of unknown function [Nitrospina watsonii]
MEIMAPETPNKLLVSATRINLYYLNELFRDVANEVSGDISSRLGVDIPLTAGMWGGTYLVADPTGVSRTNVKRLYSIVSFPQGTPLDQPDAFEMMMRSYSETLRERFDDLRIKLDHPNWGEIIPYSNRHRPTTALQMNDSSRRVNFARVFFVPNRATWSESIIYDMIRNVRQLRELLDIDRRPKKVTTTDIKFMLQDILITYFTLKPALNPDFDEHADPIIKELFKKMVGGMTSDEEIQEQYHNVYANALAYGYEEALEGPYKREGLDIFKVEDWPVDKINFVPQELKDKLVPYLEGTFETFRRNLTAQQG